MKINNRKFLNPHYDGTVYTAHWEVTTEGHPNAVFHINDGNREVSFYLGFDEDYKQDMAMLENLKKEIEDFLEATKKTRPEAVKILARGQLRFLPRGS